MFDGVIKYRIEHRSSPAPDFAGFDTLEALRARLFALGLIGEKDGIGYGNISKRVGQSHSFFITATQTGKLASLSKAQYSYIDDYDFERFTVFSEGSHKPSSEALSHAVLYEMEPEINVVIHIHSRPLWLLMKAGRYPATTAEYGTAEMVDEIASLYQHRDPFSSNAFVMKGHEEGIITFGRSVAEAEFTLYRILQHYLQQSSTG